MGLKIRENWDFVFLTGRKGKGKSKFARHIIKSSRGPMIIWDRQHEYKDCGYLVFHTERLADAFKEWKRIVYQPSTYGIDEFEQICEFVWETGNLLFIVEEVHEHAHARGYSTPIFERIVRGGRHRGIGLVFVTRRPAVTHNDLTTNVDYIICFQMHKEEDLKYMANWMRVNKDKIRGLKDFHSLLFDANNDTVTPQLPCPI